MSNNILFIAYHFPPDAAVGALRTQKFVKYLPEYDWQPFVLTVQDKFYPVREPKRLNDVEKAVVVRTSFWRTPLQLIIDIRDNHIRGTIGKRRKANSENSPGNDPDGVRRMSRVKRFLASLNHFPDDKMYWLIPGLVKGIRLIKKNNIRLIVVSAPPRSSFILAYLLAVWTRSKLVMDYRDPWNFREKLAMERIEPAIVLRAQRIIEKRIMKRASGIVTTNEPFKNVLLKQCPFLNPDHVHVIHNGFDSSDFPGKNMTPEKSAKFIITYVVSYYMQHMPADFLHVVSAFMNEKGLGENDLEVRFIGDTAAGWNDPVRKMIKERKLGEVVKITGRIPYAQTLQFMKASSLLILTYQDRPYQIPAKTYEYIGTGNPILALIKAGAAASLIEEMHCGICADPEDMEAIKSALNALYDDYQDGGKSYASYDPSPFERQGQAIHLSKIIKKLSDADTPENSRCREFYHPIIVDDLRN